MFTTVRGSTAFLIDTSPLDDDDDEGMMLSDAMSMSVSDSVRYGEVRTRCRDIICKVK